MDASIIFAIELFSREKIIYIIVSTSLKASHVPLLFKPIKHPKTYRSNLAVYMRLRQNPAAKFVSVRQLRITESFFSSRISRYSVSPAENGADGSARDVGRHLRHSPRHLLVQVFAGLQTDPAKSVYLLIPSSGRDHLPLSRSSLDNCACQDAWSIALAGRSHKMVKIYRVRPGRNTQRI